jgi:transketolase
MLRLIIGPSPQIIKLPDNYELIEGVGSVLEEGNDAIIFCYGPVMLHEALVARKLLNNIGFYLKVVNLSWLNLVDIVWLDEVTRGIKNIYVLEDHSPVGGLGDFLLNQFVTNGLLGMRHFEKIAVEGHPACGNPKEVLAYHGLDGSSLFKRIGQRKN